MRQDPNQKEAQDRLYQVVRPKSNPWLRTILVGGAALTAISIFTFAFFAMNAITTSQTKSKDPALDVSKYKTDIDTAELDQSELLDQLSDKKLDEDIYVVNNANKPNPNAKTLPPPPKPAPVPSKSSRRKPSTKRVAAPRVIYRDRPPVPKPAVAPPTPKPASKPVQPKPQIIYKTRPAPKPKVQPAPKPAPSVPSDPYQAWEQLTNLGSFAGGDVIAQAEGDDFSVQDALYSQSSSHEVVPVFNPSSGGYNSDYSSGDTFEFSEPERPFKLALGTTIKGKLLHDVAFIDGLTSTDKAVIELSEPLGTIPKGAMISTQITGADGSGALSMEILGYEVQGKYSVMSLPEIQGTSAPAETGRKGIGKFASKLLNIGADFVQGETGQSIDFGSNVRVSSVSTDSGNRFLDRAMNATASEILRGNSTSSRTANRKAPKVKKGSRVYFVVVEPMTY